VILPPRLRLGDRIGIAAPAGPADPARLAPGLAVLRAHFDVRLARSLEEPRPGNEPGVPSFLQASDDRRVDELHAMLADRDIRAIVLARAGYGVMRILDRLDTSLLRADPKPIVGFSDATALLAWAHAAGVRAIHGPMAIQLGHLAASDVARLVALLTDPAPPGPRPWPLAARGGAGTVRGPLVPANLTLASLLVGTRWPVPLAGAIALFEEVGERPYEIDRYFTQLALTNAIRETRAFVLGDLIRCTDPKPPAGGADPPDASERVVIERAAAFGIPLAIGAPIGHGDRNEAVPFGAACELDLDRGRLAILEGAVS
jgi:muramoyltetrapeptide carboxypeptidase